MSIQKYFFLVWHRELGQQVFTPWYNLTRRFHVNQPSKCKAKAVWHQTKNPQTKPQFENCCYTDVDLRVGTGQDPRAAWSSAAGWQRGTEMAATCSQDSRRANRAHVSGQDPHPSGQRGYSVNTLRDFNNAPNYPPFNKKCSATIQLCICSSYRETGPISSKFLNVLAVLSNSNLNYFLQREAHLSCCFV